MNNKKHAPLRVPKEQIKELLHHIRIIGDSVFRLQDMAQDKDAQIIKKDRRWDPILQRKKVKKSKASISDLMADVALTQELKQIGEDIFPDEFGFKDGKANDIPIISEEKSLEENTYIWESKKTFWVIDPVDNTGDYLGKNDKPHPDLKGIAERGKSYSINVALMHNGESVWGCLYFPAKGELFYNDSKGKTYKQKFELPEEITPEFRKQYHSKAMGDPVKCEVQAAGKRKRMAFIKSEVVGPMTYVGMKKDGEIIKDKKIGQAQYRACMVAEGKAPFSIEDKKYRLWDTAPTDAIIRGAGGALVRLGRESEGRTMLNLKDDLDVYGDKYNDGQFALPGYAVGNIAILKKLNLANGHTKAKER